MWLECLSRSSHLTFRSSFPLKGILVVLHIVAICHVGSVSLDESVSQTTLRHSWFQFVPSSHPHTAFRSFGLKCRPGESQSAQSGLVPLIPLPPFSVSGGVLGLRAVVFSVCTCILYFIRFTSALLTQGTYSHAPCPMAGLFPASGEPGNVLLSPAASRVARPRWPALASRSNRMSFQYLIGVLPSLISCKSYLKAMT